MRKFSQVLQAGRQLLLTLLSMVTRWLRSTSNLYALIGQNLEQANVDHVEYQLLRSRRSLMIDLLWCVCVVTQGLFPRSVAWRHEERQCKKPFAANLLSKALSKRKPEIHYL